MALFGGIELPNKPDPENVRKLDLLPVPMLRKMMRNGMAVDLNHFADLSFRLGSRMRELRRDIVHEIPEEAIDRFVGSDDLEDSESEESPDYLPGFNVESPAQIAELLYDVLRLHLTPKVKVKRTKGGERLTTGKKTLEQLKREHPVVRLLLEYRECSKLKGTYADSMPRKAVLHPKGPDCPRCGRRHYSDEWRVHTQILTTRAVTGRKAFKNPNLGNIPARTKLGAEIRAGFVASEGHVICQRDWAQFELRILAHRSSDRFMLEIYAQDGDIHLATAMRAFDIEDPKAVDKMLHRAPSKNVNFGVAYGLGPPGLLDLMALTYATANLPLPDYIDEPWCEKFIEKWFALYPGAKSYFDSEESKARRCGIVWTAAGRVRRIPEVFSFHSYIQSGGVRQAGNHGIQGGNADCMNLAMGELEEKFKQAGEYGFETYPLQTIYDELLIEAPEDQGETVEAILGEVMDNVLVDKRTGRSLCQVPIKSDGRLLKRWTKD